MSGNIFILYFELNFHTSVFIFLLSLLEQI
jgi:hypothetical protein